MNRRSGHAILLDHPLLEQKLTALRDRRTPPADFRRIMQEASLLAAAEVTRLVPLEPVSVRTPLAPARGTALKKPEPCIVAILRAGLGMAAGFQQVLPEASVGYIGLFRDHETLKAIEYYEKLPQDIADRFTICLDPMLATGHSAAKALDILKGVGARNVVFACLFAAPEGLRHLKKTHPRVPVYAAVVDQRLNRAGYILPGLGDAGDRQFGTK